MLHIVDDEYDASIGQRLKLRRLALGLTQQTLAKHLGISHQQVQKYEAGKNRISAGRLFHMTQVLGVSITWFFEDIDAGVVDALHILEGQGNRDILQLVAWFTKIKSHMQRKAVLTVVRSMVEPDDTQDPT